MGGLGVGKSWGGGASEEGINLIEVGGEPPFTPHENLSGSLSGKLALCCHLVAIDGAVPTRKKFHPAP